MPSQACFDNIKKLKSEYCDNLQPQPNPTICSSIQGAINIFCEAHSKGTETPVPQSSKLGNCYCCCSCFAFGTPIEVQPTLYKLIETLLVGDMVLATGPDVAGWKPRAVTELGGIAPGSRVDFMWLGQFRMADATQRWLIASGDHLFLLPGGHSQLEPLEDLRPGDRVMQADGKEAEVVFATPVQYDGGVRHIALGSYRKGESLEGHLLNSNGLVTADLAVQLVHYGGELMPDVVARSAPPPAVGSPAFFEQYDTSAYTAFVTDPKQWPPGAQPCHHSLINIPPGAWAYFTDEQAADIEDKIGDQNLGNSGVIATVHYLFNVHRGFYKKLFFVVDWSNRSPNGWYFNAFDQQFIVLSGALARVPELGRSGLAIVLGNLIARSAGYKCNGIADYEGVADVLRAVWTDELFFLTFDQGLQEILATFALIEPDHRGEDPEDVCRQPSIECREAAIRAGSAFAKVPDCAKPGPAFAVTGAEAEKDGKVIVTFNHPFNISSVLNPENFAITDQAFAIAVEPEDKQVVLTVENLQPDTEYTVTVSNVYSETGHPLTAGHDHATFHTGRKRK